ncbi:MAG: c-type cytochrome [Opitutaceae bacterium]|nr:c-type cytochrome [Opitutaceae bacterium]
MKSSRLARFVLPLLIASAHAADSVPADLELKRFSGPDITPCVACLCVSAQGEVYAGVDLNGSLGKGPGKGRIVKLIDADRDGVADSHTVFAEIDNARGLLAIGTQVFVLHTHFGPDGLATGMNLSVLDDANRDGVADGPARVLVSGICAPKSINSRGTDHSTNGIRMGIDGWIYIAVGDFGFVDATGTDGTKLTLLGGGVARVRADGTELELYTTGTRNIYDVAIDPFLNGFTRGNTNDGGGWNVRFLHHMQSAEFGYPRLFKNFATEIIPALEDVGGGSGVGALFLSEPTWPARYNNQPLMADWGRKAIFLHRLTPDGATFRQEVEEFAQISQVTDLDVDPSGQMFVGAWDGAGFKGDPGKGYVARIVPKGWTPRALPDFATLKTADLLAQLASASATARFYAQRELLARPAEAAALKPALTALVRDAALSLAARVAALFTLAQLDPDPRTVLAFSSDGALREFALRAAADRLPRLKSTTLPLAPFVQALQTGTPREQAAAAVALGRLGRPEAATALLGVAFTKPATDDDSNFTQKDTLKGTRSSTLTLDVRPGDELRFHFTPTDAADTDPAQLALTDAAFTLADGKRISLSVLAPKTGRAAVATPAPAADAASAPTPAKSGKKGKQGSSGPALVLQGAPVVTYTVPVGAVSFNARAARTGPGGPEASIEFFASTGRAGESRPHSFTPRHATPNSAIVIPHVAAHALVRLRAVAPALAALGTPADDLALWALSQLHEESAVDGLLARLTVTAAPAQRSKLLTTLARLYQQEAPYDGSWWWGTRPDTRGPYYKPVTWSASPRIAAALEAEAARATAPEQRDWFARLNDSHRLGLKALGTREVAPAAEKAPTVDLAAIAAKSGAVGTTPLEDILVAIDKLKPNHARGEALYTQQGCIACHALQPGGAALGPFMGQIGAIMNPTQIATAILRPSDTISQGFQTVSLAMKDGSTRVGFATETTSDKIVLRDMAGAVSTVATADVKEEKHLPMSMMPEGLANALSLEEFAALVHFLADKK